MHPQLLSVPIAPGYGTMLLLAWGVGWWLTRRRAVQLGIATWQIDWVIPLLLISAGVGARLAGYLSQLLSGGETNDRLLYGGLVLAVAVGMGYAKMVGVPLARFADSFAFSLPVGISLLRVGCFLAGCCWGDVCDRPERIAANEDRAWQRQVQTIPATCGESWPIGVRFPQGSPAYYQHLAAGVLPLTSKQSLRVHPVQLYEAVAVLLLLVLLRAIDRRLPWWGDSFLLLCFGYSAIRFVIEWWRADHELLACDLTLSQWVSLASVCACLCVWSMRVGLARPTTVGLARPFRPAD